MLLRLEWLVLRPGAQRREVKRWFAQASAEAPELAIRISAMPS